MQRWHHVMRPRWRSSAEEDLKNNKPQSRRGHQLRARAGVGVRFQVVRSMSPWRTFWKFFWSWRLHKRDFARLFGRSRVSVLGHSRRTGFRPSSSAGHNLPLIHVGIDDTVEQTGRGIATGTVFRRLVAKRHASSARRWRTRVHRSNSHCPLEQE